MLKKISMLFLFTLLGTMAALAQNGRGHLDSRSAINVTVDGFTCNNNQGVIPALSWSFGVTTPTQVNTGGGGVSGKANLSDLSVTRRADGCTPLLFAASVSGKVFKSVTIVQQDTQKDDTFTVTLTTSSSPVTSSGETTPTKFPPKPSASATRKSASLTTAPVARDVGTSPGTRLLSSASHQG